MLLLHRSIGTLKV